MSQMTRGITASVAGGAMCGIAGRVNWSVTPAVTCAAAVRIARETTDEGLREVTSQTTLQTMYDIALPTKGQTTVQTTSQTIRGVIPWAGESIRELQA
jgi:hypothetical protein